MMFAKCLVASVLLFGLVSPQLSKEPVDSAALFYVKSNGKYGFMDKNGSLVVKPRFAGAAARFSEGLAGFAIDARKNKRGELLPWDLKYGYLDDKGKIAISPVFDEVSEFHEGLLL